MLLTASVEEPVPAYLAKEFRSNKLLYCPAYNTNVSKKCYYYSNRKLLTLGSK